MVHYSAISLEQTDNFQKRIWDYYRRAGRHDLPWRQPEPDGAFDPYKILVSEIMLQQTQVTRVLPKYGQFLQAFPTVASLAQAELGDVLRIWQGLGYNRRAKYLKQAAQAVSGQGQFPHDLAGLVALPGVGANTAGAVLVYAYNLPALFIETNIRTVYLYHFFRDVQNVSDAVIRDILTQTLDQDRPREFYWALMDYGTYLKASVKGVNKASKHYMRQSSFEGSRRQLRGKVLRVLAASGPMSAAMLSEYIADERFDSVAADLVAEHLIDNANGIYHLSK